MFLTWYGFITTQTSDATLGQVQQRTCTSLILFVMIVQHGVPANKRTHNHKNLNNSRRSVIQPSLIVVMLGMKANKPWLHLKMSTTYWTQRPADSGQHNHIHLAAGFGEKCSGYWLDSPDQVSHFTFKWDEQLIFHNWRFKWPLHHTCTLNKNRLR